MKTKLVLADDHTVVRAGIRNAIKGLPDLEIIGEVGTGPELLEMLGTTPPDCLLIDVTMPDFDPIAAIRDIRVRFPQMKILVVSAFDDDIYVQGLLGLGVSGYHLKDQPLSDLRLAVQRVLAGERWVSGRLLDRLVRQPESNSASELTARQRDMLRLLHKGLDNRNIALQLGLSIKTVENHLTRLYRILDVRSRLEAMNYIIQHPDLLTTQSAVVSPHVMTSYAGRDKQTILIVDDNERYRHQLMRMIGSINPQAQIYEAENSQRALYFAQQIRPRLVFVDVVLGDENGIFCVQRITKISSGSRVVLFSAYPDSEFRRMGIAAGAIAFLDKKNLDSAALRQILDDLNLLK